MDSPAMGVAGLSASVWLKIINVSFNIVNVSVNIINVSVNIINVSAKIINVSSKIVNVSITETFHRKITRWRRGH